MANLKIPQWMMQDEALRSDPGCSPETALFNPHRTGLCGLDEAIYLFPRKTPSSGDGCSGDLDVSDLPGYEKEHGSGEDRIPPLSLMGIRQSAITHLKSCDLGSQEKCAVKAGLFCDRKRSSDQEEKGEFGS